MALPYPVNAQTRDFGTAGGFEVGGQASTRDKAGSCIATFDYAGPGSTKTTIFRSAEADDASIVWFNVVNFEWSAKEKDTYELQYWFDDEYYDRTAVGVKMDYIYNGFMTGFPADEFLETYAKASSLHIYMGDTVVDKLSLTGSSAGVALFNRCWTWLQGTERAAQKERDRYKDIPRDPFAKQDD
ncbi:MAG: hypothetical protein IE932_11975 [Sphingopyxis terrae]|nr:hypothetical protein [Sphingopyxis terrae]